MKTQPPKKESSIFVRMSPAMKQAFEALCEEREEAVSVAVRRLITEAVRTAEAKAKTKASRRQP